MNIVLIFVLMLLLVPATLLDIVLLRVIFGLIFVLFVPGYVLIMLLFPREKSLGNIERFALSVGASIVTVPILVLILYYSPLNLSIYTVLCTLDLFVIIMLAIAFYKRRGLLVGNIKDSLRHVRFTLIIDWWKRQNRWEKVFTILLSVAILGSVITLSYAITTSDKQEKYTEFYILNTYGEAQEYPKELFLGQIGTVNLITINNEHRTMTYRVTVAVEGRPVVSLDPFTLNHNEEQETEVNFLPTEAGDNQKVSFSLYKPEISKPYHTLYLWINVK